MNSNHHKPLKRLALAFQYLWRLAIPFWMFRDAGKGTMEQRIANYRYNRAQRNILPFFIGKWVGIAVCLMQITQVLSDLMTTASAQGENYVCAAFFCMSAGIGFAFACIVLMVLSASYLYLTYVER